MSNQMELVAPVRATELTSHTDRIAFASRHFEQYDFDLCARGSVDRLAREVLVGFSRSHWRYMQLPNGVGFVVPDGEEQYESRHLTDTMLSQENAGLLVSMVSLLWWRNCTSVFKEKGIALQIAGLLAYIESLPDAGDVITVLRTAYAKSLPTFIGCRSPAMS